MTVHPWKGTAPVSRIGRRTAWMPKAVEDTLISHLARAVREHPDSPAFTFVDFAADPAGHRTSLTWAELGRRVDAVARTLQLAGCTGERVAVVAPQGPAYVVGFLGALRAGAVAVPLFPPHLPGHDQRLISALVDAAPVCLLTTTEAKPGVLEFCSARRLPGADRIIAVDAAQTGEDPPGETDGYEYFAAHPSDCAYLQYTSGSTRTPTGVEITHANVVANVRQSVEAFGVDREENHVVSWLPLFHDMGLVLAVAIPVVRAVHSVLMDPAAFIQHPVRWLELLGEYPGAVTAAPNFAYDYCVRRVAEAARTDLALHGVSVMINGSEPIRAATLSRFEQAFAPCGLRPQTMRPSYGLAEATVFVSTSRARRAPEVTVFDRESFKKGKLHPDPGAADGSGTELVSCGEPVGQEITIADPDGGYALPEGTVGEIWVRGPNVARGYWRSPVRSVDTFRAELADAPADGRDAGHWLRTGDLGALYDGCLYVTGRIKDLVIIDGVNHYPQDIETTVQEAHAFIRTNHVAAFSLTVGSGERLVVVAEHSSRIDDPEPAREEIVRAVRRAIAAGHGATLHDFVLAPPAPCRAPAAARSHAAPAGPATSPGTGQDGPSST